jgi:hypothetical protein
MLALQLDTESLTLPDHPVLQCAADELRRFLGEDADLRIDLRVDPALPPYAFAIACAEAGSVRLHGHDATATLHAAYTLLEKLGWRFEITGARRAYTVDPASLVGWQEVIQPAVQRRGIRQHINFPMDISSYPLEEAKEYIRNLARLRFNHITFHSYGGQWYEGAGELAGNYFYGQRHDLPDYPLLRSVLRNRRTYCIPEHEGLIDDAQANSKAAMAWLAALMDEAKRVGLHIQFSLELREPDMAESLATIDSTLKTYPRIDTLEIITEETGMWASTVSVDELRTLVQAYFLELHPDIDVLLADGQRDLAKLIVQIGHGVKVIQALHQSDRIQQSLALGVYCAVPADHKAVLALLQRYVPEGVEFTLLFDHGNRAVADNLSALDMPREDWRRTLVYSWIEFDGTVYLFQNALKGIDDLVRLATEKMGGEPVHGIALNHWRTAENQTTARYAAETLLNGVLERDDFYRAYADSLSIDRVDDYARAMNLLDDADSAARYDLPNVGFCYVGTWGTTGLGYYGVFEQAKVQSVLAKYAEALDLLMECDSANIYGLVYLYLLHNRVGATITYLQAIDSTTALQPLCAGKTPDQLTPDEQAQVRAICDEALKGMADYMETLAQNLPDRGGEGTLISFYYTPPAVLARIRAQYGGDMTPVFGFNHRYGLDDEAGTHDAPPSPIAEEETR